MLQTLTLPNVWGLQRSVTSWRLYSLPEMCCLPANADLLSKRRCPGFWPMLLALLFCVFRVLSCSSPADRKWEALKSGELVPDILLVLVSGLRADPHGQPGAEAAFIEALERPVRLRFTAAYVQSSEPFSSLSSILTGKYPSAIPICGLVKTNWMDSLATRQPWCTRLPEESPILPEILAMYGYRTAIFYHDMGGLGTLTGKFQHEEDFSGDGLDWATPWSEIGSSLENWWYEDSDAPRFGLVLSADLMVRHRRELYSGTGRDPFPVPRRLFTPAEDWQHDKAMENYRLLAEQAGRGVASLLDGLTAHDEQGSSPLLVFISSTNGMSIGERTGSLDFPPQFVFHEILLDRTLRVPLLVWGDWGDSSDVIEQPVELVDLVPTLLSRIGAVLPAGIPGQDLLSPVFREDPDAAAHAEYGDMIAVRKWSWLLGFRAMLHHRSLLDPAMGQALEKAVIDERFFLYDVIDDPLQTDNVIGQDPQLTFRMRDQMMWFRNGPAAIPADKLSKGALWDLRMTASAGYW